MKDPEYPDITFKARTFGRFAKKHRISAEIVPVDPMGMYERQNIQRTRWFVAALEKDGRFYNTTIEFLKYREIMPSVEDVLDNILNSVITYETIKGDVSEAMNVTQFPEAEARQWLDNLESDIVSIKWFLGPEAYAEFLTIREVRG